MEELVREVSERCGSLISCERCAACSYGVCKCRGLLGISLSLLLASILLQKRKSEFMDTTRLSSRMIALSSITREHERLITQLFCGPGVLENESSYVIMSLRNRMPSRMNIAKGWDGNTSTRFRM